MAARDRQLRGRHDPRVRARPAGSRRSEWQRLDAAIHDPALDDTDAADRRAIEAIHRGAGGPELGVRRHDRVVGVEDERASRIDELGEASLRGAIAGQRAVPVEMIRRDVRVHGDRRPPGQRRQLQLRELDDDAVLARQLRQSLDQGVPDVAAEHDGVRWVAGEDCGDQRGARRLALGAGHADRRRRAEAEEEVGLGHDGGGRAVAVPPRIDQGPKRGAKAGFGCRIVRVDRG